MRHEYLKNKGFYCPKEILDGNIFHTSSKNSRVPQRPKDDKLLQMSKTK